MVFAGLESEEGTAQAWESVWYSLGNPQQQWKTQDKQDKLLDFDVSPWEKALTGTAGAARGDSDHLGEQVDAKYRSQ